MQFISEPVVFVATFKCKKKTSMSEENQVLLFLVEEPTVFTFDSEELADSIKQGFEVAAKVKVSSVSFFQTKDDKHFYTLTLASVKYSAVEEKLLKTPSFGITLEDFSDQPVLNFFELFFP